MHTDRDHRIKIQFHWQRGARASHRLQHPAGDNAPASDASGTWVRVATPVAGQNWGSVFTPRIGQEVLVAFIGGLMPALLFTAHSSLPASAELPFRVMLYGLVGVIGILAGLEMPDAGQVLFNGEDTTHTDVRDRQVGVAFQHYALFGHMTIFENVAFGLRVRPKATRPSDAEIKSKVMALLKLVQLDWLADRYPHQLSGGQRQRIALARALAVEPKVLLLDEPFGALDAKVRKELRRWLRRLHDELHVTSIFVTHDQEEALEVADRVVLMNAGKVEQVGSPQEVWDHPASPFVYGFLGDVNMFHGRAHEGEVHLEGLQLQAPEHAGAQNAKAFAYVRPHDLDVQRYAPGATGIVVQLSRAIVVGPIARLELIPAEDTQPSDNPNKDSIIEAQIPAQQFRDLGFKEGETLVVTPRRARVFVEGAT
ncbi:TOBE-like domain-containing protein [uncultured Ramlibacter sp.]|uniref:sulfate/molybdate ABC transporter ATP-binding protein n=1 Tax=uncultured Ramlibacter sp. TaxID=260755 RepID=UPI0026371B06|nr:TOBE-like domain-containing protein [uncultured Ramlibacter sp.]